VEYRTVSMYDILHRLGFSCRKPRPKHPESASEPGKRAFKKKARRIMRDNPGHTVTAVDAASHIIGRDTRSGRYPKGRPATAPVTLSRKRFHSFGALVDGGFECRLCDRLNGDSFTGLPGRLRHKYGKLIVVLDNAGYHKSKKVAEFVGSCNGDIIPVYLPPYTPELNPTEGQWKMMRKATANRLYDTKVMRDSIWAMLASGGPGVAKMSGYLT